MGRITNGEVIQILQTFPDKQAFGDLKDDQRPEKLEFLRELYGPLRDLFGTTTTCSRANRTRITRIVSLEIPKSLHVRFPQFEKDPLEFWERLVENLPQYSKQNVGNRARTFLESAAQLDVIMDEQRILRRFVAVSVYRLFQRAIPTSGARVLNKNVEQFLKNLNIPNTEEDINKYGDIIRRGQRHRPFCMDLKRGPPSADDEQCCDIEEGAVLGEENATEDYGPLFFSSIPDTVWDEKGLVGKDLDGAIEHLQHIDVLGKSKQSKAQHMAKILLDFHAGFVWITTLCPDLSNKRRPNTRRDTQPVTKRRRGNEALRTSNTTNTFHQEDTLRPRTVNESLPQEEVINNGTGFTRRDQNEPPFHVFNRDAMLENS
ncbi:hypothetical protein BO78DRAFT_432506 [Aspergillus sclerotiicarbonarius CBS 121057]|uniref:Uncharacterized protein n=1 Tax=Aspergillus sclerotiicarbonarius (strain CBS 121057 / IBT 28362) TaxID=1448318 RepID=A0A319EGR6_ASPSB|nr:hypothetical protein BO78DRAFT_432506 [Aspergillus sclerotiicarbonarius CBS 121057]